MSSQELGELILRAVEAIENKEKKRAGLLLHQALEINFTHKVTWRLLQRLLEDNQPLPLFQEVFSQKYYPQKAHLVSSDSLSLEEEIGLCIPTTGSRGTQMCSFCKKLIPLYVVVCPECDEILSGGSHDEEWIKDQKKLVNLKEQLASHESILIKENQKKEELAENSTMIILIFLGSVLSFVLSLILNFDPSIMVIASLGLMLSLSICAFVLHQFIYTKKNLKKLYQKIETLKKDIIQTRSGLYPNL